MFLQRKTIVLVVFILLFTAFVVQGAVTAIQQGNEPKPIILAGAAEVTVNATDYSSDIPFIVSVGTGGDLKVDLVRGGTVLFKNRASGSELPYYCTKIYNSNGTDTTTATDVVVGR